MVTKKMRIDLKASSEDEINLRKAAAKLGSTKVSQVIMKSVKQVAENDPFFVDRKAIRDVDANISKGQQLLQSLIDELKKVLPDTKVTIDDVKSWYGSGRSTMMVANTEAIREFIIDSLDKIQNLRYPGLNFSRDQIDMPDLTGVMGAAGMLIEVPEVNLTETGIFWKVYAIDEGKIKTLPEKIEEVKNQYRCYAVTPEERQKLSQVLELCSFMTGLAKDFPDPAKFNVPNVAYWDDQSARYEPSEYYVKFSLK